MSKRSRQSVVKREPQHATPLHHQPSGSGLPIIAFERSEVSKLNSKIKSYEELENAKIQESHVQLSAVELDNLVAKVVRHMLFKNFEKPHVPVKRQELVEMIQSDYKNSSTSRLLPAVVLTRAQTTLIKVMGLEMREIKRVAAGARKRGPGGETTGSSTQYYVLRSALPTQLRRELVDKEGEEQGHALLMTVLALIHLGGEKLEEEELLRHLSQLGVKLGEPHPVFGDVPGQLARFEQCRYIQCTRRATANGTEVFYEWAENADDEVGQEGIKKFIETSFKRTEEMGHLADEEDTEDAGHSGMAAKEET